MKRGLNIFCLFCLSLLNVVAQEDSAKIFLKSKLPPIARIHKTMTAALLTGDFNISQTFFNKLTAIPEIGNNDEHFHYACTKLANAAAISGKMKDAIGILKKGVEKTNVSDSLNANSYGMIGFLHFSIGEYEPAVTFCMKALEFAEKAGINRMKGSAYNDLGLIFSEKNPPDYLKALEYLKQSEAYLKPYNIPRNMGLVYLRLGNVLTELERYSEAEQYLIKALKIADSTRSAEIEKWSVETYAKLLQKTGNTSRALELMKRSLEISGRRTDYIGNASAAHQIASLYLQTGDLINAAKFADSAIRVSSKIGQLNILHQALKTRSEVYEKEGDFKKALIFFKKHKNVIDTISKTESIKNIDEFEQKYKTQKQQKELAEKEKQLVQQESQMQRQQQQRNYFIFGIVVLSVFLLFVYKGYKNKQRTTKILVEKNHLIEEKNREILDSISYAKRIQTAILPPQKLVKEYLPHSFILYKPKDIVAGDFYWMEQIDSTILFAAADCTGHGVPGAMVSVVCHNALNRSIREYRLADPGKILDKTREIVLEEFEKSEEDVKDGMDISLCALNIKNGELKWAGANNPLWIIRKDKNEVEETKGDKQPIGKYADQKPFTTHNLKLHTGDSVYVFTDGYQDQFGGEKGKKYKAGRIKEVLLGIQHFSMEEQREKLENEFANWQGKQEQVDDVTFIGIRV